MEEVGIVKETEQVVVRIDPRYYRPTEVDQLCGDASKAADLLHWRPIITFDVRRKSIITSIVIKFYLEAIIHDPLTDLSLCTAIGRGNGVSGYQKSGRRGFDFVR